MYFLILYGLLKMVLVIGIGVFVMFISELFFIRGGLIRCMDGWGGDDFCFLFKGVCFEKFFEIYNKYRYMIRIFFVILII